MATLEELIIKISADTSQVRTELGKMSQATTTSTNLMAGALNSLKSQMLSLIPAVTVGAAIGFSKKIVDLGSRLNDLEEQTGLAASTLSVLGDELSLSGGSLDGLAASMQIMNDQLGQAVKGNEQAAQSFTQIGLSVEDLKKMSPEDRLYAIVEALAKLKDQYALTEAGRNIFGREFAKMIPVIKETNGKLREHIKAQEELGAGITEKNVHALDDLGDSFTRLGNTIMNGAGNALGWFLRQLDKIPNALPAGLDPAGMKALVNGQQLPFKMPANASNTPQAGYKTAANSAVTKVSGYTFDAKGNLVPATKSSSSGKSSGASSSSSDAARIIDMTRTAQEKYDLEIANATKLLNSHQINQETFNRYQEEMQDELTKSAAGVEDLSVSIRSSLGNAFEDAIFDAKNFSGSLSGILGGIARQIARVGFIDPASKGISSFINDLFSNGSSSSILSGLIPGRATGDYDVQNDMVVKVHKGEMIIPAPQAMQMRGGASESQGITIVQHNSFGAGVSRADIEAIMPQWASATHDAVFTSIQRGGSAARIVGRR